MLGVLGRASTSTVVMPSACAGFEIARQSSNMRLRAASTPCAPQKLSIGSRRRAWGCNRARAMSKISSNSSASPSRSRTSSACVREPLVKMSLRPGSAASAAAKLGERRTARQDRCRAHNRESSSDRPPCCRISPRSVVPCCVVIGLAAALRLVASDAEALGDELAHALVDLGEQVAVGRIEGVVEIEDPGLDMVEAVGASSFRS